MFSIPFHVKHGRDKLEQFVPEVPLCESVAVYIWGTHLYTVGCSTTRAAIAKEPIAPGSAPPDWTLAPIARPDRKTPGLSSWELFTKIQPGHYYSRDLEETRVALHRQAICPRTIKSGTNQLKALCYNNLTVHALPKEADICMVFLQELTRHRPHSIVYRGESLAGFNAMVFDAICARDPREPPSLAERTAVLQRNGGLCETCGDPCTEVDHAVPRAAFGLDANSNYVGRCKDCHAWKTNTVDRDRIRIEDANPFTSRFNMDTYAAFVSTRRPAQTVAVLHAPSPSGDAYECDVRSCRYAAITEANNQPVPIFSPYDMVEEMSGYHIADYTWIEIDRKLSPLKGYVYDGPRFYDRSSVQYMLEHNICNYADCKLSLQATTHRRPQELAVRLKFMKELWSSQAVAGSAQAEELLGPKAKRSGLLGKMALLGLIGLWGRTQNWQYITETTAQPEFDIRGEGEMLDTHTPGSTMYHDITTRREVKSHATLLPLNLIGRSIERLQVARLAAVLLKSLRIERLIYVKVDCIVFQPPKKKARQICEELEALTHSNIHEATRVPLQRFTGPLQDAIKSNEPIFQVRKIEKLTLPGGKLEIGSDTRPSLPRQKWETHTEPLHGPDVFAEKIIQHILDGQNCCILGAPGVGKTEVLKKVAAALRARGDTSFALAPTHAASRLLPDGATVHHFVARNSTSPTGCAATLLIDEVSMLSAGLVAAIDHLRVGGARCICFGDWDQLEVVSNSWRGKSVAPQILKNSLLLNMWSDGHIFRLTRCRRSEDPEHFRFYSKLPATLATAIAHTKRAYPQGSDHDEGLHLCISHRKRKEINALRQAAFSSGKVGIQIPASEEDAYIMCIGTPLVATSTGGKFVNGAFFECVGLEPIQIRDTLLGTVFECTIENLQKHATLAWACVYHKVQGLTIEDRFVILHSFASPFFRRQHLYVGASRVKRGSQLRWAP